MKEYGGILMTIRLWYTAKHIFVTFDFASHVDDKNLVKTPLDELILRIAMLVFYISIFLNTIMFVDRYCTLPRGHTNHSWFDLLRKWAMLMDFSNDNQDYVHGKWGHKILRFIPVLGAIKVLVN